MTTRRYDSFVDLGYPVVASSASVSSASHSTLTSSSRQRTYHHGGGGRDQQIFRRAGSSETGGNEGFLGNNAHTAENAMNEKQWPSQQRRQQVKQWPMQQQQRQLPQSSRKYQKGSSSSSMDWPDSSSSFHDISENQRINNVSQQEQQQLRPLSSQVTNNQFIGSRSGSNSSSNHGRRSPINSNVSTSHTVASSKSQSSRNDKSPQTVSTAHISTPTMHKSNASSRGGMVNKLVSMFSTKSTTSPAITTTATSIKHVPQSRSQETFSNHNNPQHSTAVQFQNLSISTTTNNNQQRTQNNNYNQFTTTKPLGPNSPYPPISPARSNAQSSVSGGDSSSYNPTGWPGTVDKRGKTYSMEPSYSESEEGSASGNNCSPRNKMMMRDTTTAAFTTQQQYNRQYRQNHHHQDDGDDSQAELEDWINGSAVSMKSSGGGPVDLDEVYEERSRVGNGWRRGHQESLSNISETKTPADLHLESALKTPLTKSKDQHHGLSLSSPYPFTSGRTAIARGQDVTSDLHSPSSVCSSLDEESIRRGIDTSLSESRVRASGRNIIHKSPIQQRMIHDDEVDFGVCDDEVNFDEYSPDDIQIAQHDIHRHQPSSQYDDEVDFECSSQDFTQQPRIMAPTEEALRLNNSRSAPPRPGGSVTLKGFRGFIDKTGDVPNLMDDLESEANTSFSTKAERRNLGLSLPLVAKTPRPSSVVSSNVDSGSDVFEGIAGSSANSSAVNGPRLAAAVTNNLTSGHRSLNSEYESFHVNQRNNPFKQQKYQEQQQHHRVDFLDPSLNLSAVTKGSAEVSHHDIVHLDDFVDDGFDLPSDLSMYCVEPESVRLMVRAFRKMCTNQMEISNCEDTMLSEFEQLVDTKKRFALFEMRSRIMETDIDRGLERRGGTSVVDDIILTPYFQAMHRVRDAVIVSKAWRDGATPKDVVTAHLLTRRSAKSYFVRRPLQHIQRHGMHSHPPYWLEEVRWLDDADFSLMRCISLGAGTMKGFEMFTIGDCQSILLKMTSDNCTQLRRELRSAMMCQIEAEEVMQEEIDLDGDQYVVAEAEQLYRDATVEVKRLSMKLVLADKAFSLVRSRMEKLVETIESLLIHMENAEDPDGTSSSNEDENDAVDDPVDEVQEREKLVKRAKRAELSAEVAIRETLMAKEEIEKIKMEKQREIDNLKQKLDEMETQSQHLASRYSTVLAGSSYLDKIDAKSILLESFDRDREMEDGRQAAKAKWKLHNNLRQKKAVESSPQKQNQPKPLAKSISNRGEEMYEDLLPVARSLNSVQRTDKR